MVIQIHNMSYLYFIVAFHFVLATYSAIHALIYKKDSRAAFGWIAVSILLPFLGPLLYFIFGVNRVRKRAHELKSTISVDGLQKHATQISDDLVSRLPESLIKLEKVSSRITNLQLFGGNELNSYYSGEDTYREMLKAINNAKDYIYLCLYIFKKDKVGKRFIEALLEAKKRGVNVYILIDGIGEYYSFRKVRGVLIKNDIKVIRFLPPKLVPFNFSINLRNHRKLLIIDDNVCFIGGMNISEEYYSDDKNFKTPLKDIHFKVSGPVLMQLKEVFESDWRFVGGNINLHPSATTANSYDRIICRTIVDGPGENLDHLSIILLTAINSANKTITLMTPYFLPSRELIAAFQIAALRGVNITIILPEKNNLSYVHWATNHMLWELVGSGVNVYFQPGPFSHSKLFVIDNLYSLIGSANIDPRSLRLNYEVGLEVYDEAFAINLTNYAQEMLRVSRPVTLEEVDNRSLLIKIRDGIAWLFSPYL